MIGEREPIDVAHGWQRTELLKKIMGLDNFRHYRQALAENWKTFFKRESTYKKDTILAKPGMLARNKERICEVDPVLLREVMKPGDCVWLLETNGAVMRDDGRTTINREIGFVKSQMQPGFDADPEYKMTASATVVEPRFEQKLLWKEKDPEWHVEIKLSGNFEVGKTDSGLRKFNFDSANWRTLVIDANGLKIKKSLKDEQVLFVPRKDNEWGLDLSGLSCEELEQYRHYSQQVEFMLGVNIGAAVGRIGSTLEMKAKDLVTAPPLLCTE